MTLNRNDNVSIIGLVQSQIGQKDLGHPQIDPKYRVLLRREESDIIDCIVNHYSPADKLIETKRGGCQEGRDLDRDITWL